MTTAKEIRDAFLDYFEGRGHRIVASAPVIPQNDPTLLFINAGMNQFKDVFLGTGTRDYKRAVDTQKCVRVSGKHNDLEEVGVDTYHHTFFEMLGNWSFGDYFKREAIEWAWDLLVNVFGLDPDRLYVTVFAGDEADGLEADTETEALWPEVTGVAKERVLRFGKKDNFWEMGDTGPCGPCTEIHYDCGPGTGPLPDESDPASGVNADSPRVMEIWNLVFIQMNRGVDGVLTPLPNKHVDTGMGLERLVAAMQGKTSNYDTDLFTPIFHRLEEVTGVRYGGGDGPADVACRVVADHVRTLSVAFADGALPGNEGRGYVLRRLLRRAARFGRQALRQSEPFIHRLTPAVVEILGDAFPEVAARRKQIELLIESEEEKFAQTLDKGLVLYGRLAKDVKAEGASIISGDRAFKLYETYGFPRDLVELMAREDGLTVEAKGWDEAEAGHREVSKAEDAFAHRLDVSELEGLPATEVTFYDESPCDAAAKILKITGDGCHVVLDRTPFYAESGGQVGDTGEIIGTDFVFRVDDTQKQGDVVVHTGEIEEGSASTPPAEVKAHVDMERRRAVMANHTGTHLLHWALRKVLGDHATQQGSLVAPDRLRFDVTHPKAITSDELDKIEDLVNREIRLNTPLATTVENLDDARERGVTALFGEKYDERVRVVDIGGFSTELCGGTHCRSTGDIGALVIASEGAVQAGVRRIEALTGEAAIERIQNDRRLLREAADALKTKPQDVPGRVAALKDQLKDLKKSGGQRAAADAGEVARGLLESAPEAGGSRIVVGRVEVDARELAAVADVLRNNHGSCAGVLIAPAGEKVVLVAFASEDLAGKRVHAGKLAGQIAQGLGGGGGGRPDFAQAGGRDPGKIAEALEEARAAVTAALGAEV